MAQFYQNVSSLGLMGGTLDDACHSPMHSFGLPQGVKQIKLARYQLLFNAYDAEGRCVPLSSDS